MQDKRFKEPVRKWCNIEHSEAEEKIIENIAGALGIKRITAGLIYDRIKSADIGKRLR